MQITSTRGVRQFGTALVTTKQVMLIRRLAGRRAAEQAAIILANLDAVTSDLEAGAVVGGRQGTGRAGACGCSAPGTPPALILDRLVAQWLRDHSGLRLNANGHGEAVARRTKLLTLESWVTRATWYDYALARPEVIPFRSSTGRQCQDLFFDPFAAPGDRPTQCCEAR